MMINRGPYPEGALSPGFVTFITALTESSLGYAVMASGSYNTATGITVSKVTAGLQVLGRLEVVEGDGYCSVDLAGSHLREYPFVAGATPTLRDGIIGGATAGCVASATQANGGRGIVVSLDLSNHKVLVLV
jgi:hypothetical protein